MAKFCTLASSSSGNSVYISASGTTVLVDAGISCRRICQSLEQLDCVPTDVAAVLVTHEHIDHIKGLKLFLKKSGAAICATEQVLEKLIELDAVTAGTPMVIAGDTPFDIGNLEISCFATQHDSADSVGFRLQTAAGQSIAVATDLGCVTDAVLAGIGRCDLAYLESNYDEALLRMGSYPYYLKKRIASDFGHLENAQCGALAATLLQKATARFVLGHLSKENNNPALAHQTVAAHLAAQGAQQGVDFTLEVSPYDTLGRLIQF